MAVYTDIKKNELVQYLKQYELGKLESYEGIESGVENSNYRVKTDKGKFILTLYEKRVKENDLPFFVELMDHLASKNFVCPQPQKMKNGERLGRLANRASLIVSHLDGSSITQPTAEQCAKVGEVLAQLHLKSADFNGKRINALNPQGWGELVNATRDNADTIEKGLGELITTQYDSLKQKWPDTLPNGIIHADLFKDNIFFKDDNVCGVIDFYFACNDILAYDLAIAINAWAFDDTNTFMPQQAQAFIQGYQNLRELSQDEKMMFPILLQGAALRFLLTRIYDWLNVPDNAIVVPHDPKVFSERLRYFVQHQQHEIIK